MPEIKLTINLESESVIRAVRFAMDRANHIASENGQPQYANSKEFLEASLGKIINSWVVAESESNDEFKLIRRKLANATSAERAAVIAALPNG